jgi:hypothetical protein
MAKGLINQNDDEDDSDDAAAQPGADDTDTADTDSNQEDSGAGTIHDPLLLQCEKKIESELTPENRVNYLKIVVAGMHTAMDGGHISMIAKLRNSPNPIRDCAIGAVTLVLLLRKQARGVMPLKAMVPAGMTLMLKALDFAERTGIARVDQPALVQAVHIYTTLIFRAFKISPQMIKTAAINIHKISQDPGKMRAIELKAGTRAYDGPGAGNMPNINASAGAA